MICSPYKENPNFELLMRRNFWCKMVNTLIDACVLWSAVVSLPDEPHPVFVIWWKSCIEFQGQCSAVLINLNDWYQEHGAIELRCSMQSATINSIIYIKVWQCCWSAHLLICWRDGWIITFLNIAMFIRQLVKEVANLVFLIWKFHCILKIYTKFHF